MYKVAQKYEATVVIVHISNVRNQFGWMFSVNCTDGILFISGLLTFRLYKSDGVFII